MYDWTWFLRGGDINPVRLICAPQGPITDFFQDATNNICLTPGTY